MKTEAEIKKGLECHAQPCGCELGCPYTDVCNEYEGCPMCADAHALIEQLQTKLAKAVEDMTMLGRLGANVCPVCEHYNHGEGSRDACISCITQKEADCFRWRGMPLPEPPKEE